MRCLTLAKAIEAQGGECRVLATPAAAAILQAFGGPAGGATEIEEPADLDLLIDRATDAMTAFGANVAVSDHYRLNQGQEARLGAGRKLAVIDDLPDRAHACDVLIDPGFGEDRGGTETLAGPAYALVRAEFAALREASLARRGDEAPARALISLGLTDFGGVTEKVLAAVAAGAGELEFDIVVGGQAPSVRRLIDLAWSDGRLKLHIDAPDMARLMARADIAVGAGGSSTWERACLGLPSITLILADNQAPATLRLAELGGTIAVDARKDGWEARLAEAWTRLVDGRRGAPGPVAGVRGNLRRPRRRPRGGAAAAALATLAPLSRGEGRVRGARGRRPGA